MTTVEYQLTKGEFVLTETLRKLRRLRTLLCIGILFIGGIIFILQGGSLQVLGWAFLIFAFLTPLMFGRAFQKVASANPILTSKITMSFGDAGIILLADGFRSEREWRRLTGWSQSDKYFFLHVDSLGTAITIPKSAFTKEQLEVFCDQLSNIGGKVVRSTSET
jgi:hypothetical protein